MALVPYRNKGEIMRVNDAAYADTVQRIKDLLRTGSLSESEQASVLKRAIKDTNITDTGYLKTLLFPDLVGTPSRIPTNFTMSTAIFKETEKFTVNTGPTGSGWIGFIPVDTVSYAVIGSDQSAASGWDGNPNSEARAYYNYPDTHASKIYESYAQARLVGAAMTMSYIGQFEASSGYIQTAHIHDSSPIRISEELIEDGYFFTESKPLDGMRVIYAPKDNADLEFADTSQRVYINPAKAEPKMMSVAEFNGEDTINVRMEELSIHDGEQNGNHVWRDSIDPSPAKYIGQSAKKGHSTYPAMIVISWRGLPANQEWIRMCTTRIFETIPRYHLKEIIETRKPRANKAAIDNAHAVIQKVPALLAHKKKDADGFMGWAKRSISRISDYAGTAGDIYTSVAGLAESMGVGDLLGATLI